MRNEKSAEELRRDYEELEVSIDVLKNRGNSADKALVEVYESDEYNPDNPNQSILDAEGMEKAIKHRAQELG